MGDIFHNARAMQPFMTDAIQIDGPRPNGRRVSWSGRACLMDNGFADPISEQSVASTCRTLSAIFPIRDWVDDDPPRIGDRVTLDDLSQYTVTSVRKDKDVFTLTARETKPPASCNREVE